MNHKAGLLDKLYEMVGCDYISSMKEAEWRSSLIRAIRKTAGSDYALEEWSEALSYLFDEKLSFLSEAEISEYIEKKSDSTSIDT